MGLPFSIVQGLIGIMDTAGNIVQTITSAALQRLGTQSVIVGGNSPFYEADVALIAGKKKLLTDATVTVEQIFGQDNFADNWFWINVAGAIGDTVRVQIAAYIDPTGVERSVPATDVTITLTSLEAGKELVLRDKIISALNANGNFSPYWKASSIKDNTIVHISSKFIAERGERLNPGDFLVTTTGTTNCLAAYDNIKRRGKPNSGQRDPSDRRLVTVGISGEVTSTPGSIGDLYIDHVKTPAGSDLMTVNGSVTPVVFSMIPSTTKDTFISEMRFYGNANGIKFGQFLGQNNQLTNGILVEIKSDDQMITLPIVKMTDDFKHYFSFGSGQGFQLNIQSGRDDFMASFKLDAPFAIRKQGTFTTDDYIKVYIRDNLTSGVIVLEMILFGFEKEV